MAFPAVAARDFSPSESPGEAVGQRIASHKAEQAADECGEDVGARGEVVPGAQEHRILEGEGSQGGIAATEPGGERQAQVGGFYEAGSGKPAEEAHEQAATVVDDEGMPGHIRGCDSPAGADEITGEVAQHTAGKAAAAYAQKSFERKDHGAERAGASPRRRGIV